MRPGNSTQIDTMHLQGGGTQTLALRLILANLLNAADLRPAGVSPSTLLVVRRMADPLPGQMVPRQNAVRVNASWERAAREALAELYRRAARPARGYVPGGAEAVLFADEGEWLACLALDVSRDQAWQRWWWRAILRAYGFSSADTLPALLCRQARRVPAALHYLTEWGQAVTLVEALTPDQAMAVLGAVMQAQGIAPFEPEQPHLPSFTARGAQLPTDQRKEMDRSEGRAADRAKPSTGQRFRAAASSSTEVPWENWLSPTAVPRGLARERACLLGIGLSLHRRPSVLKSHAFLQSLHTWWADRGALPMRPADRGGDRLPTNQRRPSTTDTPLTVEASVSDSQDERHRDVGARPADRDARSQDGADVKGNRPTAEDRAGPSRRAERQGRHTPRSSQAKRAPAEASGTVTWNDVALVGGDGVNTQLGGVLYLVNLMHHLDLPGCFEEEWVLASRVGAWGILEILSRTLLGEMGETMAHDPLWPALATLDGREWGELPGRAYRGGDNYRLPVPWLEPLNRDEETVWHWTTHGRRLRLWSNQGFLLVDCPRPDEPLAKEDQAREELGAYGDKIGSLRLSERSADQAPMERLSSRLLAELNPDLSRWLAMVVPYIRWHLQQALGPDVAAAATAGAGHDPVQALLLRRGQLYVTASHVDLVMALDDISMSARLAGLDRDPGWVADFGRVVLFHFE